ncbi:hypothetical protein OHR68_35340 [Spirillospora sp. NBC_00431]
MGVEKRLLQDAKSYEKQIARLDEAGFIQRTLEALGIPSDQETTVADATEEAGRSQRPAPAGHQGCRTSLDDN